MRSIALRTGLRVDEVVEQLNSTQRANDVSGSTVVTFLCGEADEVSNGTEREIYGNKYYFPGFPIRDSHGYIRRWSSVQIEMKSADSRASQEISHQ